jgi:hypothetical protein
VWSFSIHNHISSIPYRKSTFVIREAKKHPLKGAGPTARARYLYFIITCRLMMEAIRFKPFSHLIFLKLEGFNTIVIPITIEILPFGACF